MEIEGKDLPKKRILLFLLMYIRMVFVIFFGTEQRRELSRLLLLLDLYVVYDLVVVAKKGKGERDSRVFSAGVRVDREISFSFSHMWKQWLGKGMGSALQSRFRCEARGK